MDTLVAASPTLVEKEQIPSFNFSNTSINKDVDQLRIMKKKLRDAMVLGNMHRQKIKIVFQVAEGVKEVRTTVWAADDKYIILKKGVVIPTKNVLSITI